MGKKIGISVNTLEKKHSMGDMFGIFFEDLNHAADGGLYAEMIRNRSFEFEKIDNANYDSLTAWKINGLEEDKGYIVETLSPVSARNPHYLTLNINDINEDKSVVNEGFNTGLPLEEGEKYNLSIYSKKYEDKDMIIEVSITSEEGKVLDSTVITVDDNDWKKYTAVLSPKSTTFSGRLKISFKSIGKLSIDHVSLFPQDTFMNRENGLRKDIADLLDDLKPKFLRFPGGCLVHGGSVNSEDRDSMYRWKNTIGDVIDRPARKGNWGYNQTLGLGYYEYFCLSEDLGAKPLPVLPGGYNPHQRASVPIEEIGEWVDEALDLIEFANGDENTKWGKVRADLGHKEPFNLEYIAIGNEEVGEEFFERYPYFQKAINERYPEIKVIGTSGPFTAGGEFERGWNSAIENKADLVDEHYYTAPEWFLANIDRYSTYKEEDPKVFLGEYATWGNTYYNALVEAAFMTRLQENAHAVGLACYAPLLCNVGYVNWKPDLIWFDNHQVFGTPNYYVQKLFMHHQGDYLLETAMENVKEPIVKEPVDFTGDISLEVVECSSSYRDIKIINDVTGEIYNFDDHVLTKENNKIKLMSLDSNNYTISYKAKQTEGHRGFFVSFGGKNNKDRYFWEVGGWQNQDAAICEEKRGRNSCLTQSCIMVDSEHEYDMMVKVNDKGLIETYIDGEKFQSILVNPVIVEELYTVSSVEEITGDIIIKVVNINNEQKEAIIKLKGEKDKSYNVIIDEMKDFALEGENTFENPTKISSSQRTIKVDSNEFEYTFAKESVTVLRIKVK